MKKVEFEVEGKAIGKGRPRFTRYGHAYTPQRTREYEQTVKYSYISKYGNKQLSGALKMDIEVFVTPPKATNKKMKEEMLLGKIFPTKKPDCDNIVKSVADSLNGIAYEDDKQIVDVGIRKKYAEENKIKVKITELN